MELWKEDLKTFQMQCSIKLATGIKAGPGMEEDDGDPEPPPRSM